MKEILTITRESFAPYGKVIAFSPEVQEPFEIIVSEPDAPWRVAVYRYDHQPIVRMEQHPTSMETFEPIEGTSILVVAEPHDPVNYQIFLLDQPVCLYRNVWHQVLSLSPKGSVKITENLEVNSEFYYFEKPLRIVGIES